MAFDVGFRYSFQATDAGRFRDMRPNMRVANYLRVTGAGTLVLVPKLPADGNDTETFQCDEGQVITGAFVAIDSADEGCFPIDVAGD